MRYLVAAVGAIAALLLAGAAWGGGWATVGFEPLPDGTAAGETWRPTIVVKQHGVTPAQGVRPEVTIADVASGDVQAFTAVPTSTPGEYEAEVVFPTAGEWRVTVHGGFAGEQVTYGPVSIGAPSAVADPGRDFLVPIAAAALAALVLAAGALLVVRRGWRPTPAGH